MIISASRRTDIPTYYSEWFMNRIKEGFLYVRNPMNAHQISEIKITPDVVDCIVFWTKNPGPMIPRLDELKGYTYYFQFTLTGYDRDMEANIPDKETVMIPTFKQLSEKIGKERVIWRYDPIVFTPKYSIDYHLRTFDKLSKELEGYTEKCVISFVDIYAKNKKNMEQTGSKEITKEQLEDFASKIAAMARSRGMTMATCAEVVDLEKCGIEHNHCVDKELIERLTGYEMGVKKDPVQREECGCMVSMEIGTYNTCRNGCKYCYANFNDAAVRDNCSQYDPKSPLLCGTVGPRDVITERKVKSNKGNRILPEGVLPQDESEQGEPQQLSLFDLLNND